MVTIQDRLLTFISTAEARKEVKVALCLGTSSPRNHIGESK